MSGTERIMSANDLPPYPTPSKSSPYKGGRASSAPLPTMDTDSDFVTVHAASHESLRESSSGSSYDPFLRRQSRMGSVHTNNPGLTSSHHILPQVAAQFATPSITAEQRDALQQNRDQYIGDLATKITRDPKVEQRLKAGQMQFQAYHQKRMADQARKLYETSVGGGHMPQHQSWAKYYHDLAWRRAIVPDNVRHYNIMYGNN